MNGTHSRCCHLLLSRDSNQIEPDTLAALSAWVPEPPWRGVTTTSGLAILLRCSSISDYRSIPEEHAFRPLLLASTPSRPKFLGDDLSLWSRSPTGLSQMLPTDRISEFARVRQKATGTAFVQCVECSTPGSLQRRCCHDYTVSKFKEHKEASREVPRCSLSAAKVLPHKIRTKNHK